MSRIDLSTVRTDRPDTFASEIRQIIESVEEQEFTAGQIVHLASDSGKGVSKPPADVRRSVRAVIRNLIRDKKVKAIRQGVAGNRTPGIYKNVLKGKKNGQSK